MRRLNVVVVLVALLGVSLTAAGIAGAVGVVAPKRVTARVLPKHINPPSIAKAKYTWHVHGKIIPPKLICPPGVTAPSSYCTKVPRSACNGKVRYIVKMGHDPLLAASGKEIGHGTSRVRKCAYKFSKHFKTSLFISQFRLHNNHRIRHVGVRFFVRFLGNSILKPKNARRQIVIAKVLAP